MNVGDWVTDVEGHTYQVTAANPTALLAGIPMIAENIRLATPAEIELEIGMPYVAMEKYNSACAHAKAGRIEEAWSDLELCIRLGFNAWYCFSSDKDLEPLVKQNDRFEDFQTRFLDTVSEAISPIVRTHQESPFVMADVSMPCGYEASVDLKDFPCDSQVAISAIVSAPRTESSKAIMREVESIAAEHVGRTISYDVPPHRLRRHRGEADEGLPQERDGWRRRRTQLAPFADKKKSDSQWDMV